MISLGFHLGLKRLIRWRIPPSYGKQEYNLGKLLEFLNLFSGDLGWIPLLYQTNIFPVTTRWVGGRYKLPRYNGWLDLLTFLLHPPKNHHLLFTNGKYFGFTTHELHVFKEVICHLGFFFPWISPKKNNPRIPPSRSVDLSTKGAVSNAVIQKSFLVRHPKGLTPQQMFDHKQCLSFRKNTCC